MRTICRLLPLAALAISMAPGSAEASEAVGLGVSAGVAVPHGGVLTTEPALNWGFHVDIPILDTFAISPSTYLYRLNGKSATDVSLNFKFVIPLGRLEVYGGATAGLTNADDLNAHVGALAGAEMVLVSNLNIFAQANYRVLLQDGADARDLMIFAGPVFRF